MTDFRKGRHVVHHLNAHLILTTKYRRGAITTDRVRDCLAASMRDVCADFGARLDAFEADGDHVHLLLSWPPQVALSRLVGSLKGVSAPLDTIKAYVEAQSDPNRSKTGALRRAESRKRKKTTMATTEDALTSP